VCQIRRQFFTVLWCFTRNSRFCNRTVTLGG
jgi:hypothetical protein